MKKTLLALCILCSGAVQAQNFLWGVSGGGKSDQTGVREEWTKDMAIDRNDNIYIISQQSDNANVAGQSSTYYGYADFVVASFKPDGTLRWKKVIGAPGDDFGYRIAVDDKDGVYFCGDVDKSDNPCNIDVDATSPKNLQAGILIKYDTAGNYQWHRFPEPESQTALYAVSTAAMDVDKNGNVYWLVWLITGSYGSGALTVPTDGAYILKYSASGAFSYIKPQIEGTAVLAGKMHMTIDEASSRMYLSGTKSAGTLTMGGNVVDGGYIACFNLDGTYVWSKWSVDVGFAHRPTIDATGNIYLAGGGTPPGNFNGYSIVMSTTHSTPFVVKMDKNGNNIWARNAVVNAVSDAVGVAIRSADEVVIAGSFPGRLEWPGYSTVFTTPQNSSYDMYTTRFRASDGAVVGMDKITNYLNFEAVSCVMGGGKGNTYIGGEISSSVKVNDLSTMNFTGGARDWCLIKYGNMWKTGVNAVASNDDIKLYPNPVSDQLNISGLSAGTAIQVYDVLGREVTSTTSNSNATMLDVSGLIDGNYSLQLTKDGERIMKQFVKQ